MKKMILASCIMAAAVFAAPDAAATAAKADVAQKELDKATADKYRALLEAGDTEDPMELYKKFRGQAPTADALLRNRGLK